MTNVEPHIYALRQFLVAGEQDYLTMFTLWKNKLRGANIDPDAYVERTKEYAITDKSADCDSCNI